MADVIAKRYSQALFELGQEKAVLDEIGKDAHYVIALLTEHPELVRFLGLPDVSAQQKKDAMSRILKEQVRKESMGIISLMIEKARVPYLIPMFQEYLELLSAYKNQVTATVRSAAPLTEAELEGIRTTLAASLKKEVQIETVIDETLIGGLVVRVGDKIFDNSIRSSLQKLSGHLKALRIQNENKGGIA